MLFRHRNCYAAGVADQAVNQVEFGTGHHRLLLVGRGRILGHEHLRWAGGPGPVGRRGAGGVAGRGHGEAGDAQFHRLGYGGGDTPGLEGAGGVQPFFLDVQALQAQLLLQVGGGHKGRAAFAQGYHVVMLGNGHQFGKPPHVGVAAGENVTADLPAQAGQVVAGEQHLSAALADLVDLVVGIRFAALGTLQVVDVTEHGPETSNRYWLANYINTLHPPSIMPQHLGRKQSLP